MRVVLRCSRAGIRGMILTHNAELTGRDEPDGSK
jgi:hypothetical protein